MSLMISGFNPGTLAAGTEIPAVDVVGGVRTNVRYNAIALLQTYAGTSLTIGGVVQPGLTLNPAQFSISGTTLSVVGGGGSPITLSGTTITAFDPTLFTESGGTVSVETTSFSSLAAPSSLAATNQILIVANGTAYSCTLQQLAAELLTLTQPSIDIAGIAAQYVGNPFVVTGTLANYTAAPTLRYEDGSGVFVALPGGATVTATTFSFAHPAPSAAGSLTVSVEDANGVTATSASFAVSYATATAATFSGVPSAGTAGTSITGVTVALTPSYAQAYAVLDTGGADQGARTSFTGSSVPALTPTSSGSYTIVIYAASAGGTALATSSAIAVSATAATAATITGAPSTGTGGVAITGVADTLTPGNATAYAVLNTGGADQGARVAFSGTSIPALTPPVGAAGSYTIKIYAAATGGAALGTSGTITVTDIATAATISGAPSAAYEGAAITGLTASITPPDATAYAALFNGASQQGTRTAFTGTAVPSLTPTGTGSYTVQIYAAATGGTALATSAAIAVTVLATAATVTAPATGTAGGSITATVALTPTNATAWACANNGADVGSRVAFTGTSVAVTLGGVGNETIKVYATATGGTALGTSGTITVNPAAAPSIGGGVAPAMVLDASVAANVTADAALTTPQTTNGGSVQGWKDATGSGFNWTYSGGALPVLVTNSQNGLQGIEFPGGGQCALNLTSAQLAALTAIFDSTTQGVTIALVCEYSSSPGTNFFLGSTSTQGGLLQFNLGATPQGTFAGIANPGFINGSYPASTAANTLNIVVMTYDPSTLLCHVWINNNASPGTASAYGNGAGNAFTSVYLGNITGGYSSGNNYMYELDIWPTLATGAGGASPTGDVATIMSYLQSKWA